MKLDTQDIIHQEFRKIFRGYDPVEVRAFLEVIAEKYRQAVSELQQIRQAFHEQQQINASLADSLKKSENEITSLRTELKKIDRLVDARIDGEMILAKARSDAEALIQEARQKADQIRKEVAWLETRKQQLAENWRQYLTQQLTTLNLIVQPPDIQEDTPPTVVPANRDFSDDTPSAPKEPIPQPQSIADYLDDTSLDDLPEPIRKAIRQSSDLNSDNSEKIAGLSEERRKQMLDELRLLNQQSTAMFRKADFEKMLGEAALKKSEDLINQIYSELEKKNPSQPTDTENL